MICSGDAIELSLLRGRLLQNFQIFRNDIANVFARRFVDEVIDSYQKNSVSPFRRF